MDGKLFVGETLDVTRQRPQRQFEFETFTVRLADGHSTERSGKAENVLGSPLRAPRFLVEQIARFPGNEALKAGEVVTAGTLAEALPFGRGETWQAEFFGIGSKPIRLQAV